MSGDKLLNDYENSVKIIDDTWYTLHDGTTIGIVTINTGFAVKRYIGIGAGRNREDDIRTVVTTGVPFYG